MGRHKLSVVTMDTSFCVIVAGTLDTAAVLAIILRVASLMLAHLTVFVFYYFTTSQRLKCFMFTAVKFFFLKLCATPQTTAFFGNKNLVAIFSAMNV